MVVVVDARRAMRYVSPSHRRVLGHAPETLHGRMTLDYTHPDDVARVRASFAACLRAPSTPVPVDLRLRHADGSWRTVESIMDNRLDDPAVGGVIITSRDITDRTRAEESLRLSEARYRALSEHASDIVAILGPDGTMRYASPSHHRILGYRPEEIVGSSVLEWTHPDDRVRARDAVAACLRQPGGTSAVESRLRHADGRWVTLESITDNRLDDLAIGGIVVTSRDVTARARAEEELRASEERLRTVVTNAPIILFALDRDGVYTMSEGMGLAALGREPGGIVGRSVFDVYRDQPALLDWTRRALAGEPVAFPSYLQSAVFDNRLVPLHDAEGRLGSVIGVSTDITERARAEAALEESRTELERSNADLARFAYVASHDLQEPLRTVSSYLSLLKRRYRGQLDESADEFIDYAVDGATRMSALIRDVLAYSRVGTRAREFAPVDCAALVAMATADLQARIADTGARVTAMGLPTVCGDETQLGQLFQNLIGNALKFCRDAPDVRVSAERQGDAWLLRVRDNGIGIAPEQAERIFQVFQRLHSRTEYEGTGIGLAVCKRIVERHGGRIWVESEPGHGATFLFTLPAVREQT